MDNWIPFAEGEYLVDQALLVADNRNAMCVEDVIVEVYADQRGRRYLKGRGRIRNMLMVELLDDSDDLDMLLDFGFFWFPYILLKLGLLFRRHLPLNGCNLQHLH